MPDGEFGAAARGFLWAGIRYRLMDVADLAWQPIDAILGSRFLAALYLWGPVLVAATDIVRHEGRYGLITNCGSLLEWWGGLYASVVAGRRYRKVKPPKPKPRRAKE